MKIASWNVNSIKVRRDHVKDWLKETGTDVLLLQELKGQDFPADTYKKLGYESHVVDQKARNGVAVLSKHKAEVIVAALPGNDNDGDSRYMEVDVNGVRVINIYAPNGNPYGTEKFDYKMAWMARLLDRVKILRKDRVPFLIGGDFNVIPEDIDAFDPAVMRDDALIKPETRRAYRALLNQGLTDAFRIHNASAGQYTYWDYQGRAWESDKGIRIDHFLLAPPLADRLESCNIDRTPRGRKKASDHTPICVEISL